MINTLNNKLNLGIVDNSELSIQELLHTFCIKGKEDVLKEIQSDF